MDNTESPLSNGWIYASNASGLYKSTDGVTFNKMKLPDGYGLNYGLAVNRSGWLYTTAYNTATGKVDFLVNQMP